MKRAALLGGLLALAGCRGCARAPAPALRLTYEVDVAHAYDGKVDTADAMTKTRAIVERRVEPVVGRGAATVSTSGTQVTVDLPALAPAQLDDVKAVIARSGRFEIALADDESDFFAGVPDATLPEGEGIGIYTEQVPVGVDENGQARMKATHYARMALQDGETMAACRARFERWAATLAVPQDRRIGLERVSTPVASSTDEGWRTFTLHRQPELTGASVSDASVQHDTSGAGGVYVALTFDAAGAARFEAITAANVERRMAILFDGVVDSAPVIKSKISGGHASLTMGAGDPGKQLADAHRLELLLRAGALPAPLELVSAHQISGTSR